MHRWNIPDPSRSVPHYPTCSIPEPKQNRPVSRYRMRNRYNKYVNSVREPIPEKRSSSHRSLRHRQKWLRYPEQLLCHLHTSESLTTSLYRSEYWFPTHKQSLMLPVRLYTNGHPRLHYGTATSSLHSKKHLSAYRSTEQRRYSSKLQQSPLQIRLPDLP